MEIKEEQINNYLSNEINNRLNKNKLKKVIEEGPKPEDKQSEIAKSLQMLHKRTTELTESVEAICIKLEPVLRKANDNSKTNTAMVKVDSSVSLSLEINSETRVITLLAERLDEIIDLCEL